ncbi:MAG: pyruvate,orthophosphate dikinase [Candidatus Omnitrophota bacterium]
MKAAKNSKVKASKTDIKKKKSVKYVYYFGGKKAEGTKEQKLLLGGKGANLAEMINIGIPVPPGFTVNTQTCRDYYANGRKMPAEALEQIWKNLAKVEKETGKTFGGGANPLLVSVRSGAAVSMPGMMDTVLNLGLNDTTVVALAKKANNPRFAYDSYRRFIQMYSNVVLEIKHEKFEHMLESMKAKRKVSQDTDLTANDLIELVGQYKALVKKITHKPFPLDTRVQLKLAVLAVFKSWQNDRANTYRNLYKIDHNMGTAVNVQSMVYGNLGNNSGTGVAFTRDPSTGERRFFGEYLINAQGEDVVAGIRTPSPISELKKNMPKVYATLEKIYKRLEKHYKDMQDIEFTFEDGVLYLLQTRGGKRAAAAAVRIACEMVGEGLIGKNEAIKRVEPDQLDQLLHPMINPKVKVKIIAKGLPASPGAAVGHIVFESSDAIEWGEKKGKPVILVRAETSPEDVGGMNAAQGILTQTGGMTSHAAVVARGMGKCCVVGCAAVVINSVKKQVSIGGILFKEGDFISLNGSTGEVIQGKAELMQPTLDANFAKLMGWADKVRKLDVRTNADSPEDAKLAREFGAQGIGLCRTEHMFFGESRLRAIREMIFADRVEGRRKALAILKPYQKKDFKGIFKAMKGLPVTVRLLDPPLHEFLPKSKSEKVKVANDLKISKQILDEKIDSLHEFNPMLGHRGCRLAVTYPEIYEMQTEAIIEAACELKAQGITVLPEIMIPLIGTVAELNILKDDVKRVADAIIKSKKSKLKYMIGTMIEVPRAAVTAGAVAESADFFSFGTNDLTQMTFGFSRDDVGKFLPAYIEKGLLADDPFVTIDQVGVGSLVRQAVQAGRKAKPGIKLGICGEHGGDPRSVDFCHRVGLNYVSCSPFRVPIARLAAAHAVLDN